MNIYVFAHIYICSYLYIYLNISIRKYTDAWIYVYRYTRTQRQFIVGKCRSSAHTIFESIFENSCHICTHLPFIHKQNAASQKLDQARAQGLKSIYEQLNITSDKHKASVDYIFKLTSASEPEVIDSEGYIGMSQLARVGM